jgi:hypothetical protein
VNGTIGDDNGAQSVSGAAGGHHHYGHDHGGAFMQSVMQALQQSGLSLPTSGTNSTTGTTS